MTPRPSKSADRAVLGLLLGAALGMCAAAGVRAQNDESQERGFANLESIAARAEAIVEQRREDFDRLQALRAGYPSGRNPRETIEERNLIVPRVAAAHKELDELNVEFGDYARAIQTRLLLSGLNSMMSEEGEGLAVSGLSRFMDLKGRMHAAHAFSRQTKQFLLEEKPEFLVFHNAYRQRKRAIAAAAFAGLVVMGATGAWFYRRKRIWKVLPPPPPAV